MKSKDLVFAISKKVRNHSLGADYFGLALQPQPDTEKLSFYVTVILRGPTVKGNCSKVCSKDIIEMEFQKTDMETLG